MKTATELYSNCGSGDYNPMLKEFGTIVVQVDDNDYQGDSRVLYQDGERYGYLQFGWGSCSGCDMLQGCRSMAEVQELMDFLYQRIMWFSNKEEARTFFATHDWKGDYSWHEKEQERFVLKCLEALSV